MEKLLSHDQAMGMTVNQYLFASKVTRTTLAAMLGLSQPSVSRKLAGQVVWTAEEASLVALYFGLSRDDLLPTPDGMGGWIPAPFIPGKAKAPAAKATEANEVVAGTGFEPATSGFIVTLAKLLFISHIYLLMQLMKLMHINFILHRTPFAQSNFAYILIISNVGTGRKFLLFCMNKNHVLILAVHEKWETDISAWEKPLLARGLSGRTIETRIRHVRQFSREIKKLPAEVSLADLLSWAATKSWLPETRHGYYTSIKLFFRWYSVVNECEDPSLGLPTVRRPHALPRPTPERVLTDAIEKANSRTRLILFLGACSGLRAKEISELHSRNIINDLQGYSLIIQGKGGRERQVPLPDWLAHQLIRTCAENGGYAFPGQINGHISSAHISKLANSILETPWTLHTLRHRFATLAYSAERDLLTVQKLLGHASVSTTQRYAKPPENSLRKAITAADYRNAY